MWGCQFLRQTEQIDIPSWEQPIHLDGKIKSAKFFTALFSSADKAVNLYLGVLGIIFRLRADRSAANLLASDSGKR
jgi:hypothetical protein